MNRGHRHGVSSGCLGTMEVKSKFETLPLFSFRPSTASAYPLGSASLLIVTSVSEELIPHLKARLIWNSPCSQTCEVGRAPGQPGQYREIQSS
ncbi:hypothetical protein STEG23_036289 [Scotinomys teguina]